MTVAFWNHNHDFWNFFGRLPGIIATIIMTLVQFICLAVYFVESVFWALVRGVPDPSGATDPTTGKPIYVSIVDFLIGFGENGDFNGSKITQFVVFFIIVGFALIVLMAVISVIKSHLSTKDEDKNPTTIFVGVLKAVLLMVCFPLILFCILKVTNGLTGAICTYAKIDGMTATESIANKLFFMFANNASNAKPELWYDANGTPLFSFMLDEPYIQNLMAEHNVPAWCILGSPGGQDTGEWGLGFVDTTSNMGLFGFNYIFAIIVIVILLIGLFKACLLMGKRIFDIAVLYVVAPISISCYPNDEGKRYELWKDEVLAKTLSSLGLAITFAIYIIFIEEMYKWFSEFDSFRTLSFTLQNGAFNTGSILTVVFLIIAISGALAIPNMYNMLATLVSSTAGQVAGQDMQNLSNDMAFAQRGAHAMGAAGLFVADKTGLLKAGTAVMKGKMGLGGATGAGASGGKSTLAMAGGGATPKLASANAGANFAGAVAGGLGGYALNHGIAGLAPTVALGAGIGAIGKGIGKLKKNHPGFKQNKREELLTSKINEAVANYGNKDHLAKLNKEIGRMTHGRTQVNDSYLAQRINQQQQEQQLLKNRESLTPLQSRIEIKKETKQHLKSYKQKNKKGDK